MKNAGVPVAPSSRRLRAVRRISAVVRPLARQVRNVSDGRDRPQRRAARAAARCACRRALNNRVCISQNLPLLGGAARRLVRANRLRDAAGRSGSRGRRSRCVPVVMYLRFELRHRLAGSGGRRTGTRSRRTRRASRRRAPWRPERLRAGRSIVRRARRARRCSLPESFASSRSVRYQSTAVAISATSGQHDEPRGYPRRAGPSIRIGARFRYGRVVSTASDCTLPSRDARRTRILWHDRSGHGRRRTIAALLDAGADAFRLNFSHGTHETHAPPASVIREAARRRPIVRVAILQDLSGPKIRIGAVVTRRRSCSTTGDARHRARRLRRRPGRVSCSFDALFTAVAAGQRAARGRREDRARGRGRRARPVDDTRVERRARCSSRTRASTFPGRSCCPVGAHGQGCRTTCAPASRWVSTWSR